MVAVYASLTLDLAAAARFALVERRAAGVADGPRDHVGLARGGGRAGRVDRHRRLGGEAHVVDPELGSRHLEDHVRDAQPDRGRSAVDLGRPVGEQPHPRGAVVVEALREADVLEPDREAGAAPDPLAAGGVAGAARQAQRVARERLGLGRHERGGAADHLGGRERAFDPLAGRKHVARGEGIQQAQLDRVDPERRGELVHLGLAGEARLDGPEPAHRATGRVVRVDDGRLEVGVRDGVRGRRRRRAALAQTAVELEA